MHLMILLPLISGFLAQFLKLILGIGKKQKFKFKNIMAYSGMPSGHSAIVISLATIIGLQQGTHSSTFAISVILAIVVIRDALGIRRYLGEHGKTLNILL